MDETNPSHHDAPWQQYSVLIVDDEPGMQSFMQRALSTRCGVADCAGSVEQARPMVSRSHYDLIVLDIALPGLSGIDWLHELRDEGFAGDVVLMTAYADLDTAIDALRAGAADFLLKPFSLAQVLNAIQRCFERSSLARENFVLRREVSTNSADIEGVIGQSEAMFKVCERLKRIAPTPATVLLSGESGTGKEVAARAVHRMSPRAGGPFVPVNCAAISAELIESELFGHVKGAYTGAAQSREGLFYYARGGTLFLDEISELPLGAQAEPVAPEIRLIHEQVQRIRLIVAKLLQFARPQDYVGYLEPTNPAQLIQDSLLLVRHLLKTGNIAIEQHVDSARQIICNKNELQQVVINLLVNAIQAMPTGGVLSIAVDDWDEADMPLGIQLAVEDSGPGISQADLEHLFEPFFTAKKPGGNGLGLWVSKNLIERYGGHLTATSPPGAGARFTVWLRCEPLG